MPKINVSRTVQAAPDLVWEIIANYGAIANFHPFVQRSYTDGGAPRGVGAVRTCEFYDGNHAVETITDWNEGHSLSIDIVETSFPLSRAEATMAVSAAPDGRSTVTMEMDFAPKGLMANLMWPIMARSFRRVLGKVLDGLDRHARTGELIGKGGRSEAPRVSMQPVAAS